MPGTEQWKIRIFTPGEQPLVSFATAFLDEEVTDIERARQLKAAAEAIAALLVRTPVSRDRTSAGKIVQPFFKLLNRFPNCSTVFSVYTTINIVQMYYSTVTDLARLRGWSTSKPRRAAM